MIELFTSDELMTVSHRVSQSVNMRNILELARERRDGNAGEGLTWDELDKYFKHVYGGSSDRMDTIKKFIMTIREPEYPLNTVVKDALGSFYRRFSGGWGTFGNTRVVPFDKPERPLVVVP